MQYLTGQLVVSYRTINRFFVSQDMDNLIRDLFIELNLRLKMEELVTLNCLYNDGAKIEANVNKYTFVWKKTTEKFSGKLQENMCSYFQDEINLLVQEDIVLNEQETITSDQLAEFSQLLEEELQTVDQEIEENPVKGKDSRKDKRHKLKKVLRKGRDNFSVRAEKYDSYQNTFEGSNSFSKTDADATFMRMKERNSLGRDYFFTSLRTKKQVTCKMVNSRQVTIFKSSLKTSLFFTTTSFLIQPIC